MATVTSKEGHLVTASLGDQHGFSEVYQTNLRARIIAEHIVGAFDPIPRADTIPTAPIMMAAPTRERGVISTHVAENLQTSNDRMGRRNQPQQE